MGNETSVPDAAPHETFLDEPSAFDSPTMAVDQRERDGPNTPASKESLSVSPHAKIGSRLVSRFAHRNQTLEGGAAADAASSSSQIAAGHLQLQQAGLQTPSQEQPQQQQQQQQATIPPTPNAANEAYPVVGVMYAEGTPAKQKSAVRKGLKQSGRGLMNSMRNLSVKANNTAANLKAQGLKSTTSREAKDTANGKGSKDWETRWDEDDDESSEDEYDDTKLATIQNNNSSSPPPPPLSAVPPTGVDNELRPEIESKEHSSTSPARVNKDSSLTVSVISTTPTDTAPELVPTPEDDVLTKQADLKMQEGDNAMQWDLGNEADKVEDLYEKPSYQMFLPLLRVLGKGSFGKVVLVQKQVGKERGGLFAMKILRKAHLVKRRQIERTKTERKVLSVVDHPFIMKLHFAFQTEDKLYLVLDYCPGGELFFHLSRFRRFPERVARFYGAELLLAIGHLHKRGIIYRDLKPENVLLDSDGHVKLGDFGLAKDKIKHPCEGASSMCGTPEYMAPEVLSQAGHGFCVDYWGLGMLVYEMMTGLPPWYTTDRAKLFRRLKSAPLDIPSYFSPHAASYVSLLLERNPRRRLGVTGIRDAMAHEFFRSISWRALYSRRVEAPIRPCEGWKPPEPSGEPGDSPEPSPISSAHPLDGIEKMDSDYIDAACANFDNNFTRMKVDTEDNERAARDTEESEHLDELNEDTFVGFTFDDFSVKEPRNSRNSTSSVESQRQRTTKHSED